MEFRKKDLLTKVEIETLIYSNSNIDKTNIICNKLKKYILIRKDGVYVKNTTNRTYQINDIFNEEIIVSTIQEYIEESYNKLSDEDREKIEHDILGKKILSSRRRFRMYFIIIW